VGGVVRDLWLDIELGPGADIDLTTDAVPTDTKAIIGPLAEAVWDQGERFGTIGCLVGGREIEITTHRSENYVRHSRKPAVEFSERIEADLSRRDFTVNAMAIEVGAGELVDPFGGAADLAEGRLRTPIGAAASFTDDPLRMLRAARFTARYGLVPDDDVVEAMTELAERLEIVAVERIGAELDKLLAVPDPGDALLLLHGTGLLERVFPRLSSVLDEGDHAPLRAVVAVDPDDHVGRMAAIAWWDVGDRSVAGVREWGRNLRLTNNDTDGIASIVSGVAALRSLVGDTPSLRRWAFEVGSERERALALGRRVDHDATHAVSDALVELACTEDLDEPGIPLDGAQVMKALGIAPGPQVGAAMNHLRELRYRNGPLTVEEARAALAEYAISTT